jgi:hypothetical protein
MAAPSRLTKFGLFAALALLCGLALRLFFILRFSAPLTGDTDLYIQFARNWVDHGVYGIWVDGRLTPVDMRAPGYPAFLAVVGALFGRSIHAINIVQAFVDLATCLLIAGMAALLAPDKSRRRVAMAALWLATLCPFTGDYTAAVLTETLAIFLTALALVVFSEARDTPATDAQASGRRETAQGLGAESGGETRDARTLSGGLFANRWFLGGIVVGFATLVRPESPLIAVGVGLALCARWWRPQYWRNLVLAGVWMALGVLLPLMPWAARNWNTLHEVQFLAPRYSEMQGEISPRGFYAWTGTWLWHFHDVYSVIWKLEDEPINIEDLPPTAFDSPQQRILVGDLLAEHNEDLALTPEMDNQFAQIARERTTLHPIRTKVVLPVLRGLTLWFTPRIELLPFSGDLWPARAHWEEDPVDFSATVGLLALNLVYVGMALVGLWLARRSPAALLLLSVVVVRTAFFTHLETPEPRYVLECYPAIIAFGAQLWSRF